ncbi:MAG TPA: protein kinase, partial [Thermoanaerobaculia bacterium]|nr:protein kinase [Thermoanaerobaculia bacterium]
PDPGRAAPPVAPTRKSAATLVALELRRYARLAGDSAPEETVARLGQELRRATSLVASRQGRVVALLGHRLLAAFEGEGKSLRAVAAASEMLAGLTSATDAFDEAVAPLVVLTSGEVVSGSVALGETNTSALVGVAVQKLESLLREAAPGELLLSREVERELGSAIQESGVTPEPHRGVVTTLPFFALKGEAAARLAGVSLTTPTTAVRVPRVTPQPGDLGPGKLLGSRFEILAVLGSGGMGMVFKARDRELSDLVALKVLHRDAWVDPVQLERLKDELRLARKITHPNVLRTFDFGEVDGIHYISMEYVRGVTLRYMLDQSSRLPFSAGLRVGKQLLSGLAAAHAQGVLHRDIKPDNLILDATGNAKLMDFGIARPISRSGLGLTQEGWLVGTPQYMSPEQLQAQPVDARADLYSTGVLLYEVFTGRLPFLGTTPVEVAYQHIREAPPAPTSIAPDIPQHLEAILLRCLAKQPDDRYGSAVQLLDELEEMSL